MTLMRPRTTGRLLRGSALGLGLLVAGGIAAPAAFAAVDNTDENQVPADEESSPVALQESPAPVQPSAETHALAPAMSGDFGTGKDFTVQVQPYGPVPDDLDLSGAVFQATPAPDAVGGTRNLADDPTTYTCTTDASGECSFDGPGEVYPSDLLHLLMHGTGPGSIPLGITAERSDAEVPAGTYTLTQVSSSAGLAPAASSGTFTICDDCGYPWGNGGEVGNDSLFRTSLVTTVTDVDTDEPIACAGYELTGPDYPHDGSEDAVTPVVGTVPAECLTPSASPTTATTAAPTTSAGPVLTTAPQTSDDEESTSPTTTTSTSSSPLATIPSTSDSSPAPTTPLVLDFGNPALDLAAADAPLVSFGTQVSDGTGTMTFEGWFLPADGYLLTPTTTPAGYAPDVTDAFAITTTPQQAADSEPAAVARALAAGLAAGAPAPATTTGAAGAAAATTPAAAAGTTSTTGATAAEQAALATTGTPVGTMVLVGTGLLALGGGALGTGSILRRRARQHA